MFAILGSGFGLYGYLPALVEGCEQPVVLPERYRARFDERSELARFAINVQWEDDESGSQWSIVQFYRYLATHDLESKESLKSAILGYNRDDVIATRRLEEWIRGNFMGAS